MTIYLMDAGLLSDGMLDRLIALLPPERRETVLRRQAAGRREAAATSILGYYALTATEEKEGAVLRWVSPTVLMRDKAALRRCARSVGWPVGKYGQPFPEGTFLGKERRFLSLSHSRDMAAVGVDSAPLGIDLQRWESGSPERLRKIAAKLHPDERARLDPLEGAALTREFYRLWTQKESVLKLCGRGLSLPLSGFCIDQEGRSRVEGRAAATQVWELPGATLAAAFWTGRESVGNGRE